MKTITEQELEDLRRVNSEFNTLKGKIADAEIEIKKSRNNWIARK